MIEQTREGFDRYLAERGAQLGNAIHDLWRSRDPEVWARDPYFHQRLGELADSLGQSMFAHDILQEALRFFPDAVRLTQLYCLSLIKCGFLLRARDLLASLVDKGHLDEETLGILGRVHKEMWLAEGNGDPQHPHLRKARDLYLDAFRRSRGHYSGINAAIPSLILGDRQLAGRLSREVAGICAQALEASLRADYWTVATVAEANLVLGRQEQAARYYRAARSRSASSYAALASTRRQLKLLARYAPVDPAVLEALRIPPVLAFSGHMLDAPGRKTPRFPEAAAAGVRRRIADLLERLDARIGYASVRARVVPGSLQARGGKQRGALRAGGVARTSVEPLGSPGSRPEGAGIQLEVEQRPGRLWRDDVLFSYATR
jgi:hypothetical protein